jgi:hypothetical protein
MKLELLFGITKVSTRGENRSEWILRRLVKSHVCIALVKSINFPLGRGRDQIIARTIISGSSAENIPDFSGCWPAHILFWIADNGLNPRCCLQFEELTAKFITLSMMRKAGRSPQPMQRIFAVEANRRPALGASHTGQTSQEYLAQSSVFVSFLTKRERITSRM